MGKNSLKFGAIDNSFYPSDYQYSPKSNTKNVQDMAYKVMQWIQYVLFNYEIIYLLGASFCVSYSVFAPSA